jgi:acyl-CoA reductase-like NAD-dependent aldehyde dehydrogenase
MPEVVEATRDPRERAALARKALPEGCREIVQNWVAGRWLREPVGASFKTYDPTTGELLCEVASAGPSAIDEAVASAHDAGRVWWRMDGLDRARVMRQFAQMIREHALPLGLLDTLDAGRPIRDTIPRDVERAARTLEFFAGVTDKLRGANIPVQPGFVNTTFLEPYGVVAAITPWNYPLTNVITKVAPAIAAGNGVVLKPAEQTPLSAALLAWLGSEAGLPSGLFNVVQGSGEDTGRQLVLHPGVGKVAFTGSTAVGRQIGRSCGEGLKSVTLELGGKSPTLVFPDADLATAVEATAFSIAMNQGQTCTAGTRLLVHRDIHDDFVARLRARLAHVRIGDPLAVDTQVGPVISPEQLERIERYVTLARREGATVETFDAHLPFDAEGGYFIGPIIVTKLEPSSPVAQEEVFGPLLTILPFDDETEALHLANDTPYGLSAVIWTTDVRRVHRLAEGLVAGIIWNNTVHTLHPGSPYGGYKQSGLGVEMGMEAIGQFMKVKSLWIGVDQWKSTWQ